MHVNRKHQIIWRKCNFLPVSKLGKEFRYAGEFKEHMLWHSYQQLKFKCYEQTTKMHIWKTHSETIACGMCDFEGKNIKTLDTHTFTREMYQCSDIDCEKSFLQHDDLRSYI